MTDEGDKGQALWVRMLEGDEECEETKTCSPSESPSATTPMWQLSPEQQAALLVQAQPTLQFASVLRMLNLLRADGGAPAAPEQRLRVRDSCRKALATPIDGQPVVLVQADGASSLGVEGGRYVHLTTWSLSEDPEMVGTPEMVKETSEDPQWQMYYGKTKGEPVLTGKATATFDWMLNSPQLNTPLKPFHANDVVPASSLRANEKLPNGTYKESPNQAGLVRYFEDVTVGYYLGNPDYVGLCLQGRMGGRVLVSQCARCCVELTRANDDFYALFDLKETQVAFTSSSSQTFGLRFLNHGAQVACVLPSLGSVLAGPASGGGAEAVVSATNAANVLRALTGLPPIDPTDSPLSVYTTGKGRTTAFAARVWDTMGARGVEGWKHPTQIGGAKGGALYHSPARAMPICSPICPNPNPHNPNTPPSPNPTTTYSLLTYSTRHEKQRRYPR